MLLLEEGGELILEAFDGAARLGVLNASSVERVALGANIDLEFRLGATSHEGIAATAGDLGLYIIRMDFLFHFFYSLVYVNDVSSPFSARANAPPNTRRRIVSKNTSAVRKLRHLTAAPSIRTTYFFIILIAAISARGKEPGRSAYVATSRLPFYKFHLKFSIRDVKRRSYRTTAQAAETRGTSPPQGRLSRTRRD